MIAWRESCYRSAATARTLGAELHLVPLGEGGIVRKSFAYVVAAFRTCLLLFRRRPAVVLCLNLPVFLPLVAALYALTFRAKFIVDFHSGAITNEPWRSFLPLYRWLCRRALVTICHNSDDEKSVASWGGRTALIEALPMDQPVLDSSALTYDRPRVIFSCSFAPDEPIALAAEAMRKCPGMDFLITGNHTRGGQDWTRHFPDNVQLTGYLPYAEYAQLLAESSVVMTFSSRTHIMQMAIEEALSFGIPVVTNESPTLRSVLGGAGRFTQLSPESIATALREAIAEQENMRRAMIEARTRCYNRTSAALANLEARHPELFDDS